MVTIWAAYWTTGRLRDKFWFCTIANVCTGNRWVLLHKEHDGKYSSNVFYHSFSFMSYFASSAMPGMCWQSPPHIFLVTYSKGFWASTQALENICFQSVGGAARYSLGNSTGMLGPWSHCASDTVTVWHKPGLEHVLGHRADPSPLHRNWWH